MPKWKEEKGWFGIQPDFGHSIDEELTNPTILKLRKRMGMVRFYMEQARLEYEEADSMASGVLSDPRPDHAEFGDTGHGLDMVIAALATALHNAHRAKLLADTIEHQGDKD